MEMNNKQKNENTVLEKIQLKKCSKNYLLEILIISFKKKKNKLKKKILSLVFTEKARNLIYMEIWSNIEEKILSEIFAVPKLISEKIKIDKKILNLFHSFGLNPVIKNGILVKVIKGKNKNSIGKINFLQNDFSFVSILCENKISFDLKKIKEEKIEKSNFKGNLPDEDMLKKVRNDNLRCFLFSEQKMIEKSHSSKIPLIIQHSSSTNMLKKKLSPQIFYPDIGTVFWSKSEKVFKILVEKKNKKFKLLSFDNSLEIYSLTNFDEKFTEYKTPICKGLDCFGNIIFKNDEIRVVSGKLKNNRGRIKFLKDDRLFIHCSAVLTNGGFIALSCNQIMACVRKKTKNQQISNFFPGKAKIKKGIMKGYESEIVNQTSDRAELEISSTGKFINISKKISY